MPGPLRGADALADSPLMGPLLGELRAVFDSEVLPRLGGTDCAVFGRVGQACRDAVLRSPELACAGRTVGVKFRVKDFVGSVKRLTWAKDNRCRWDAHTCAAVVKGGRLEVLLWAREHDCPWDERTCEAAFLSGHLDMLRWARKHGCPWDSNALRVWRQGCPELRAMWDEIVPIAAWDGITFGEAGGADAGRVMAIELQETNVNLGDLPAAIGGLNALKVLTLERCGLTSVPAELGGLTALKWLDLDDNQLTHVPAELGGLTALTRLYLRGNRLTSLPAALRGAALRGNRLTTLFLSENHILTSVPAELGRLTALQVLDLKGTRLTSMPAAWAEGGVLELSGCEIHR